MQIYAFRLLITPIDTFARHAEKLHVKFSMPAKLKKLKTHQKFCPFNFTYTKIFIYSIHIVLYISVSVGALNICSCIHYEIQYDNIYIYCKRQKLSKRKVFGFNRPNVGKIFYNFCSMCIESAAIVQSILSPG